MKEEGTKNFNHKTASVVDKIALLSELEHAYAHAVRSAISLYDPEKDNSDFAKYAIWAGQIKNVRREFQRRAFPDLGEYDWCLLKALSRVRQLAYETAGKDYDILKMIDDLVDDITGTMFNEDLSQCYSCREDKGIPEGAVPPPYYPEQATQPPRSESHNS